MQLPRQRQLGAVVEPHHAASTAWEKLADAVRVIASKKLQSACKGPANA